MSDDPLLEIDALSVEYRSPHGAVGAVDGVSLSISEGEVFGLAGESGCGKSTIANSILRILRAPAVITGGQIRFRGTDVLDMDAERLQAFRWSEVSMVFQSALNALNPVLRVGDQICDVIVQHERVSRGVARERAVGLLEAVGIERSRFDAYPHELSGGMRQRVVIAIALALNPPMMIMDEPTTALDVVVQREIIQRINELRTKLGFSVLFITHDLSLMVEFSDRIGIMYAGKLVELADSSEMLANPLHPYTQGLLDSFPTVNGERQRLAGIPGAPPDLAAPPSGCRFHPRCPVAVEHCAAALPRLEEVASNHWVACHLQVPEGT